MKPGITVTYSSYGAIKTAKITRISSDGAILFLDNGKWIHRESATVESAE